MSMPACNHLSMTGRVVRSPEWRASPAGIRHCYFELDHHSEQPDAGGKRQVQCRLPVVASGQELVAQLERLTEGMQLQVTGYVSRRLKAGQPGRFMLHAVEIIEFN